MVIQAIWKVGVRLSHLFKYDVVCTACVHPIREGTYLGMSYGWGRDT